MQPSADWNRELNDELIGVLPQLSHELEQLRQMYSGDEPGSHVVFSDVLKPYVGSLLASRNEKVLTGAFRFLEELLMRNSETISEVVETSLLEELHGERILWTRAKPFMGPLSRQAAAIIERDFG